MKKHLLLTASFSVLVAATPVMAQPPMPPAIFNWTGFYVGGNMGYSWGNGPVTYNEPAFSPFAPPSMTALNHLDNVIGGVQAGYNWQMNSPWVVGVETDLQGSFEKGRKYSTLPFSSGEGALSTMFASKIDWFGTVRGRVGWLFTPTTLVYATGGLAYGGVGASGTLSDSSCFPACKWHFSKSATNVGRTVGAGVEGAFPAWMNGSAQHWTWKVEYLYLDLGSLSGSGFDTDFGGAYNYNAKFTDNILRVGVNYKLP